MTDIQATIEEAFENRAEITPRNVSTGVRDAVMEAIEQLDRGELRVAEKIDGKLHGPVIAKHGGQVALPDRVVRSE